MTLVPLHDDQEARELVSRLLLEYAVETFLSPNPREDAHRLEPLKAYAHPDLRDGDVRAYFDSLGRYLRALARELRSSQPTAGLVEHLSERVAITVDAITGAQFQYGAPWRVSA